MTIKWLHVKSAKQKVTNPIHQTSHQINIKYPFESEMTLINPQEIKVETENAVVCIENIGPGGLRFLSNLPLVEDQEIIYSLESAILEEKVHLPGDIIWSEELSAGLYQYGVQFHVPENSRTFVNDLLNDYSEKYFSRME